MMELTPDEITLLKWFVHHQQSGALRNAFYVYESQGSTDIQDQASNQEFQCPEDIDVWSAIEGLRQADFLKLVGKRQYGRIYKLTEAGIRQGKLLLSGATSYPRARPDATNNLNLRDVHGHVFSGTFSGPVTINTPHEQVAQFQGLPYTVVIAASLLVWNEPHQKSNTPEIYWKLTARIHVNPAGRVIVIPNSASRRQGFLSIEYAFDKLPFEPQFLYADDQPITFTPTEVTIHGACQLTIQGEVTLPIHRQTLDGSGSLIMALAHPGSAEAMLTFRPIVPENPISITIPLTPAPLLANHSDDIIWRWEFIEV